MDSDPDDSYLVARAQEGYLDAFELLVDRYAPLAYRVAQRLVADHHDAQDVTQESFVAAWEGLARFRGESAFSTWLYRIVTRRALNKLTRGHSRHVVDLLDDVPDRADGPADTALRSHAIDAVSAAVAKLPLPQRVAIVLHHFEGLPYAEVAAVTRSSVPAVRSHLFRARRTLTTALEQWR